MAAGGVLIPAYLDADPRFRGCSLGAKFLYQQIARVGRIEALPELDLIGTLVFRMRGLSDDPRGEVTAAIAEWERRGLVTREGDQALRTAHERPVRPEPIDIPEEWTDRQREAWERRLRRARQAGGRVDARALLERFMVEYSARGASLSADVSAPASGQDVGQRPRRSVSRTPSDVRPSVPADHGRPFSSSPSPSPSPRMNSLEGGEEEETSETSQVIARASVRPASVPDTFDGQSADKPSAAPPSDATADELPRHGREFFDALVKAGPEAFDPVQASPLEVFCLGELAASIGEPVSSYELVAAHWRQGGLRETFGWVDEVARGEPMPFSLLLGNGGKQLRLAISAARAWGRRRNDPAASTTPLADLFCARAEAGLVRPGDGERDALEAALVRLEADAHLVSAMGMLCARGELGPQVTVRKLLANASPGQLTLLHQWLEKTRRAAARAAQRPGPASTSPPTPQERSRSG